MRKAIWWDAVATRLGEEHVIDEVFGLREWWETLKASEHAAPHDYDQESARSLQKIERHIESIAKSLQSRGK